MAKTKLERELDEIYAGPPEDFIARRDAIAKRLRTNDPEAAKHVAKLKKPSKAAALVNRLALERADDVSRYLSLADELRKATSGKVNAERMRTLAREDGDLLEELVAQAGALDGDISSASLDRVRESLQAAQVDPDLRAAVASGRLEREGRAASVGLENLAAPPEAPKRGRAGSTETRPRSAKDDEKRERAREKKRLGKAKAALAEAKTGAREAAREVARAEKALAKAEREREAAERRVAEAEAKLERPS